MYMKEILCFILFCLEIFFFKIKGISSFDAISISGDDLNFLLKSITWLIILIDF